jgi:chromatin structure-remodeling complex subunit RSC4
LSSLEGDLKRLISNAKAYNSKTSEIFSDAEKVRKMLSDFMRKNNPAYAANPNHVTYPTATPEKPTKIEHGAELGGISSTDTGRGKRRAASARLPLKKGAVNGEVTASPAAEKNSRGGAKPNDFEGMTFQETQRVILTEMITLKDSE